MAEKKNNWDKWIKENTDSEIKKRAQEEHYARKMAEPVNYKLAYPQKATRSSWFDAQKYREAIAAPELEKERLLKKARKEANERGLPAKMSKGSAGRESAEKQRDRYARTAIRSGFVR